MTTTVTPPPEISGFVEAVYPFQSDKPNSLTFDEGEVIAVLLRLPTGWWRGKTINSSGWFPSNYVKDLEESELIYKHDEISELVASQASNAFYYTSNNTRASYGLAEIEISLDDDDDRRRLIPSPLPLTDAHEMNGYLNPETNTYTCQSAPISKYVPLNLNTDTFDGGFHANNKTNSFAHSNTEVAPYLTFTEYTDLIPNLQVLRNAIYMNKSEFSDANIRNPIIVEQTLNQIQCIYHTARQFFISSGALNSSSMYEASKIIRHDLDSMQKFFEAEETMPDTVSYPLSSLLQNIDSLIASLSSILQDLRSPIMNNTKNLSIDVYALSFIPQTPRNTSSLTEFIKGLQDLRIDSESQWRSYTRTIKYSLNHLHRLMGKNEENITGPDFQSLRVNITTFVTFSGTIFRSVSHLLDYVQQVNNFNDLHKRTIKSLFIAKSNIYQNMSFLLLRIQSLNPILTAQECSLGHLNSINAQLMEFQSQDDYKHTRRSSNFSIQSSVSKSSSITSRNSSFNGEPSPWYLDIVTDGEIFFDVEGNVRCGTIEALVQYLTRHNNYNHTFNLAFMMCYSSFTTSEALLRLLERRFNIAPPENLCPDELAVWKKKKQKPIQLRVYNLCKLWLESNFFESSDVSVDLRTLSQMKKFLIDTVSQVIPTVGHLLKQIECIEQDLSSGEVQTIQSIASSGMTACSPSVHAVFENRKMTPTINPNTPTPILPKNLKRFKLLDIDPLELARQFTIMESNIYRQIKASECLNKAWSRPKSNYRAEHVKAMIRHSNQITGWVAESILSSSETKKRADVFKFFISVAVKCRDLNNFSTLTAIVSAFNAAPIYRLKRTKELINNRYFNTLGSLNNIISSSGNFQNYREKLKTVNPPAIPFLGVFFTDLKFIEDGNPAWTDKARGLINFSKRMKMFEIIQDLQQFQFIKYNLESVHEIQRFIFNSLQCAKDVNDLYDLSLRVEPREREDEVITRLLKESGFL